MAKWMLLYDKKTNKYFIREDEKKNDAKLKRLDVFDIQTVKWVICKIMFYGKKTDVDTEASKLRMKKNSEESQTDCVNAVHDSPPKSKRSKSEKTPSYVPINQRPDKLIAHSNANHRNLSRSPSVSIDLNMADTSSSIHSLPTTPGKSQSYRPRTKLLVKSKPKSLKSRSKSRSRSRSKSKSKSMSRSRSRSKSG